MYLCVCAHTCAHGDQKRILAVHILKLKLQMGVSYWIWALETDLYLLGAYIFIRKSSLQPEDDFLIKI